MPKRRLSEKVHNKIGATVEPEKVYREALDRLREAEARYADAESELIAAKLAVGVAEVATKYYKMIHEK